MDFIYKPEFISASTDNQFHFLCSLLPTESVYLVYGFQLNLYRKAITFLKNANILG
jgi:hypothetical protein